MRRAILIVDHGSRLAEANAQIERVAEALRARLAERGDRWPVHVAHLELVGPDFQAGVEACLADGAQEIVVHPYFLAPGRHGTRDIPRLVDEARRRHPDLAFRVTPPLGFHPSLVDLVLERVDEGDGTG